MHILVVVVSLGLFLLQIVLLIVIVTVSVLGLLQLLLTSWADPFLMLYALVEVILALKSLVLSDEWATGSSPCSVHFYALLILTGRKVRLL